IRPGEKIHEEMVSEEEAFRTVPRGKWYAITPMLPELAPDRDGLGCLTDAYSSADAVMSLEETATLLRERRLRVEDAAHEHGELLR
ncbi:MAG TPA: hypothetical protein VEW03_16205, partial [Longimicrobiaceae bacterium]|nr:hypothetical protein [Longimicrobiaceae bacterium]